MANITSVEESKRKYSRRASSHIKVYVSEVAPEPINTLVDSFFYEHIVGLDYKSKVWTRIKRKLNSIINPLLLKEFKGDKSTFSHKCGCACGCSPGFKVTFEERWNELLNYSFWVTIEYTPEEVEEMKVFLEKMLVEHLKEKEAREVTN